MPGDLDEQFGTVWNQANQRSITILYGVLWLYNYGVQWMETQKCLSN